MKFERGLLFLCLSLITLFSFVTLCNSRFHYSIPRHGSKASDNFKNSFRESAWHSYRNNRSSSEDGERQSKHSRQCHSHSQCSRHEYCSCHNYCQHTFNNCGKKRRDLLTIENELFTTRIKRNCREVKERHNSRCSRHNECECGRRCSCHGYCTYTCNAYGKRDTTYVDTYE